MIIRFFNINDADPETLSKWYAQMSTDRKESVDSLKISSKKALRIAADALARETISEFCGISPGEIIFGIGEKGKPFVKNLPVHFSISHSGDYAVCAVSEKEIGIDIEKMRNIHPRAAERFCSKSEISYANSSQKAFFEVWTLKEAYFKCIGTGLDSEIKNVTFETIGNNVICSEKGCEFSFKEIDSNYICSVCEKSGS